MGQRERDMSDGLLDRSSGRDTTSLGCENLDEGDGDKIKDGDRDIVN